MKFIVDARDKTWFRIETAGEAAQESALMNHAVEKYFLQAEDEAMQSYVPDAALRVTERSIGRRDHVQRSMPIFATLRDGQGNGLATAMLPPEGKDAHQFRPIIVGPSNTDPYVAHGDAILTLAKHLGYALEPRRCFPYRRA